jgi:putative peptidoglycan lipid II flippase
MDAKAEHEAVIPPAGAPADAQTPATDDRVGLDTSRIAGAALIVMVFFVLSRVTGLAREVIIGAQFGTSADLDAYLAAFRLPDMLFQLAAGGALGSAFIPTFSSYLVNQDRAGAWLLFSRVLNLITLLLIVLATAATLLAEPLVANVIAPGFPPEQQALTASLMRWMLLSTIVFGASGLIMGALNGLQHFLLPAAAPVLYNLCIIGSAWLLAPRFGIYGLVFGVVGGALAHLLVQVPGLIRQGVRYTPSVKVRDPGVLEVARLMGPRVLGLFFVQMHFLVNTILASSLAPGSLSALNYAWLLMLLPQGIFAQSLATATFPTFSAQYAAGQQDEMRRTFGRTLRTVFFLAIPAAVGLIILRKPFIGVLLERGQFTANSTALVAYALQFYAVGLIAHSGLEIIVRAFYALHDTWTPVIFGIAAMVLNIVLSIFWVDELGFGGLALANSVATSLEMVILLLLLNRRMQGIEIQRLFASTGRSLIAALGMGGAAYFWLRWLDGRALAPATEQWLAALGGALIAIGVYAGLSLLLRNEEMQGLLEMVQARLSH